MFDFDYSYICLWVALACAVQTKKNKHNKNSHFFIDYSIINPNLSKILLYTKNSLNKLIKNFIEKNINTINEEDNLDKELANVLNNLSSETYISIIRKFIKNYI